MEANSMEDAYKFVLIEFFFVAIFVGEYFHSWIMFAVALVVMAILWVAAIGVPPLTKPILIGISAFLGIWGWRFGSNWGTFSKHNPCYTLFCSGFGYEFYVS